METGIIISNIFKYFWLICFVFGLVGFLILHLKIRKIVKENNDTDEQNARLMKFAVWYGICTSFPYLFLQVFQLLGNGKMLFFIFSLDFSNPFYVLSIVTLFLFWASIIYFVIIKDGAEIMARYSTVFGMQANKIIIKLLYGTLVLVGILVLFTAGQFINEAIPVIERLTDLSYA